MSQDSRPWGVLALVLFMAASLGYRWLTRPDPWQRVGPSAPAPALLPLAPREAGFRALLAGDAIDVNHASDQLLQQLPGIGPSLAQRIVEARQRAPLRDLNDLQRVRGLGRKSVAKLAPFVGFGEPPPATEPGASAQSASAGRGGSASGAPVAASN